MAAVLKRKTRKIAFPFVLEELSDLPIVTKPMFGCEAIYLDGKIVLILREKETALEDNGVWLCTTSEHHDSLRKDFPSMRPLQMFGPKSSGWQVLPLDSEDFEEAALKACRLVRRRDARIGKIPPKKKVRRN